MKFIVLIPARYQSTRFPGKPLAKIGGEEMILRVCRRVAETGLPLAVATDSQEIAECVRNAGFTAVMTSDKHRSGTERVEEAYINLKSDADVVINVQGDEPFISPFQIEKLVDVFKNEKTAQIATLARPFEPTAGFKALEDPNLVKVVFSNQMKALYFSRSVIPYIRGEEKEFWPRKHRYYSHIGIYGYKASVLHEIVGLQPSVIETDESLEQLRWLANGYSINIDISTCPTIGIDTPEDLANAEKYLRGLKND